MIGLNRQNNLAEMPLGVEVMQGVRQFRECEGVIDDRDQLEMVDRAHHRFGAVAASRNDAVDVNFFRHQRHNGNRCRKPAQDAHLRDAPAAGHGRHRLLDRSRADDADDEIDPAASRHFEDRCAPLGCGAIIQPCDARRALSPVPAFRRSTI
jgi:hypothetical protein